MNSGPLVLVTGVPRHHQPSCCGGWGSSLWFHVPCSVHSGCWGATPLPGRLHLLCHQGCHPCSSSSAHRSWYEGAFPARQPRHPGEDPQCLHRQVHHPGMMSLECPLSRAGEWACECRSFYRVESEILGSLNWAAVGQCRLPLCGWDTPLELAGK